MSTADPNSHDDTLAGVDERGWRWALAAGLVPMIILLGTVALAQGATFYGGFTIGVGVVILVLGMGIASRRWPRRHG